MARFPPDVLARLDRTPLVEIETTRADGTTRRRAIWIVVDGDDVFVRSWRGEAGVWYRSLRRQPTAVLHVGDDALPVGDDALPVRAVAAADPVSIERCSAGLRRKYRGRSLDEMLLPAILGTTLRLEPQ